MLHLHLYPLKLSVLGVFFVLSCVFLLLFTVDRAGEYMCHFGPALDKQEDVRGKWLCAIFKYKEHE